MRGWTCWILSALAWSCAFDRMAPNVTCSALQPGRNACEDGIIASCPSGSLVYEVCEGSGAESVCGADWQVEGAFRCEPSRAQGGGGQGSEAGSGGGGGAGNVTGGAGGGSSDVKLACQWNVACLVTQTRQLRAILKDYNAADVEDVRANVVVAVGDAFGKDTWAALKGKGTCTRGHRLCFGAESLSEVNAQPRLWGAFEARESPRGGWAWAQNPPSDACVICEDKAACEWSLMCD